MSSEADPRGIADAARSLRQIRDNLPAEAEAADREIRQAIDATTNLVEQAATGKLSAELQRAAHEIRLLGTQMTAAREDAFTAVAHTLETEADEVEALLRPAGHAAGPASPRFSTASPPVPAPDLVSIVDHASLIALRHPDAQALRRPINRVVAQFPPKLQALARTLLFGRSSHAVQRHGHHLTREHELARIQWRLDPAGEDSWQVNPDGSVTSQRRNGRPHQVGTTAGHYTTPEAVAKPLVAILNAAGSTQAALDAYLDGKADGETIIKVFLRPEDAGVTSEDVYSLRAPGTDTDDGEELWLETRKGALDGRGDAPVVRKHDMVANGVRPGSLVIFVKRANQPWRLITSYFADDPDDLPYTEL